jgi:hypothetical protein
LDATAYDGAVNFDTATQVGVTVDQSAAPLVDTVRYADLQQLHALPDIHTSLLQMMAMLYLARLILKLLPQEPPDFISMAFLKAEVIIGLWIQIYYPMAFMNLKPKVVQPQLFT